MNISDVWINVSKRIRFFTKEMASQIPEKPGIYAWFIPLWIYNEDIIKLLELLNKILLYDSTCHGEPKQKVDIDFNWSRVEVELAKKYLQTISPDSELKKKWDEALSINESRTAIAQTLMEASIFMPPLYVGKTKNLRSRYLQHIKGTRYTKNDFHSRFTKHAEKLEDELPIKISDLIFACIITDSRSSTALKSEEINTLIETIMLKVCKPVYSER